MFKERMGRIDTYLTPDQAAKILGVGRPQVYKYQRDGILTAKRGSGRFHLVFDPAEVHALADIRKCPSTVTDLQRSLVATRTRCRALEQRLDLIERVLCIRTPNLSYEKAEVEEVVERACYALKEPPTEVLEILDWCSVFLSIKEEFLNLVQTYTDNPEPWAPFMRLAERMDKDRPKDLYDEDLVAAYLQLTTARRALRQTVFFYLMEYRTPEYAQEVVPEAATSLIRRLNKHIKG